MKPLIGLRPRAIATRDRIQEICDATMRYCNFGNAIPIEWLDELKDRIVEYNLCAIELEEAERKRA